MKTTLVLLVLSLCSYSQAQNKNCDCSNLERLGEIYQDTISNFSLENDGDTTRWMALLFIRKSYFSTCLKGKRKRYVRNIFGSEDLIMRKESLSRDDCRSEFIYYNSNDDLGYTSISFDKRRRVKYMQTISY